MASFAETLVRMLRVIRNWLHSSSGRSRTRTPVVKGKNESPSKASRSPIVDSAEISSQQGEGLQEAPDGQPIAEPSLTLTKKGKDLPAGDPGNPVDSVDRDNRKTQDSPKRPTRLERPKRPARIGGRRHKTRARSDSGGDNKRGGRSANRIRPELICRKPAGRSRWEIYLWVDDESRIAKVMQNGEMLSRGIYGWPVSSLSESLQIETQGGNSIQFPLIEQDPLIFKMAKNWSGIGRKIRRLTRGYFIAIAARDRVRWGHIPVEPENCTCPGFVAHYFFREGEGPGAEVGGFDQAEIATNSPFCELHGQRVFDDSEHGELYVRACPQLTNMHQVAWVRVGEERQDGWSKSFRLSEESLADVLGGRQGRFFVRVYDEQVEILDSYQFRYLRSLRQILVNGEPYSSDLLLIPDSEGRAPTVVQFIGEEPIRASVAPEAMAKNEGHDRLTVPFHPNADKVSCEIECGTGRVELALHLPRIWWKMERNRGDSNSAWRHQPQKLSRDQFRLLVNARVLVQMPDRINSVFVGFGEERAIKLSKDAQGLVIPLAQFADHEQIDSYLVKDVALNVWFIQPTGKISRKPLSLFRVLADSPPEIVSFTCQPKNVAAGEQVSLSWETRVPDGFQVSIGPGVGITDPTGYVNVSPQQTTSYTLRLSAPRTIAVSKRVTVRVDRERSEIGSERKVAKVCRIGGGWRAGKGFSRGELNSADLSISEALRRSIDIDSRRRSVHSENVKVLRMEIADA